MCRASPRVNSLSLVQKQVSCKLVTKQNVTLPRASLRYERRLSGNRCNGRLHTRVSDR
jgi:hypothetical protein